MSDTLILAIVHGVFSLLATAFAGVMAYFMLRLNRTADATHLLVNSAMGAQLKLHARTARAKADITHDPADLAVADLAEKTLAEHEEKQAQADRES